MFGRWIFSSSIAAGDASTQCVELAAFFGVPYALHKVWGTIYGWEHRRLQPSDLAIGCLNQPWAGPAVVWYPEGDWVSATHTGEVVVDEEV
jgi:hypothetical protein